MRPGPVAFQLIGSLLALCCVASLAIGLAGCAGTAIDWRKGTPTPATGEDLWRSNLRAMVSVTGIRIPLSPTEEEAIIARAIAEHEMRNP
jgi:hypothetical protein